MSANVFVPEGASFQLNSGEISSPSHVNCRGILPPDEKEELVSWSIEPPFVLGCVEPACAFAEQLNHRGHRGPLRKTRKSRVNREARRQRRMLMLAPPPQTNPAIIAIIV